MVQYLHFRILKISHWSSTWFVLNGRFKRRISTIDYSYRGYITWGLVSLVPLPCSGLASTASSSGKWISRSLFVRGSDLYFHDGFTYTCIASSSCTARKMVSSLISGFCQLMLHNNMMTFWLNKDESVWCDYNICMLSLCSLWSASMGSLRCSRLGVHQTQHRRFEFTTQ